MEGNTVSASVPVVLIVVGIILAVLASELLGGVLILAGLVLFFVSYTGGRSTRRV